MLLCFGTVCALAAAQQPQTGLWECLFKCQPDADQCYYKGACKSGAGVSPQGPCNKNDYDRVCGLGVPYYPLEWMRPAAYYGDDAQQCQEAIAADSMLPCHPDAHGVATARSSVSGCPIVGDENWRDCNGQNPFCWWCALDGMCTMGGTGGKVAPQNYDPKCGMPPEILVPVVPNKSHTSVASFAVLPSETNDAPEFVCTYICDGDSVFRCMDSCPSQYAGCDKAQSYAATAANCETFIDRLKQYGGESVDSRTSADVSVAGKGIMMAVQDHLSKHLRANGTLAVQIQDQDIQNFLKALEKKGLGKAEHALCEWASAGTAGPLCRFVVNNPLTHYVNNKIVNWPPAQDLTHAVVDLAHLRVKSAVHDVVHAVNTGVHEVEDACKKAGHAIANFVHGIFGAKSAATVVV